MRIEYTTVVVLMLLTLSTVGCGYVTVEAGHQGVLIQKPWLFGHGGVVDTPVLTGTEIVAVSTDSVSVNMMPITFDETFDDIMPKDNNPVDYHAAVRLQIIDSVLLIKKFGINWYPNNVQRPFQTMNRNQVRQHSMPDLALQQTVVNEVEQALQKELGEYLKSNGIPVTVLNVSLGRISPQKEIIDAYNQTGVQQQRSKTEHQRKLAEDARKEAELSRAEADKAYQDKIGLSAGQFVQLEQIKLCVGHSNCQLFLGSSPVPVIPVSK